MIGLPLISFPIGFEESGGRPLPIGALVGGPPFGEERLLSLAAAYQAVTDWHRRRPADPPAGPVPGGAQEAGRGRAETASRRLDVLDVLEACE
jgi:hypothetical protein